MVLNPHAKAVVVDDQQFIRLFWYSVTEWRTFIRIVRLHPETHRELCQTGHPPNMYVIRHILGRKLESIVCGTKEYRLL